MISAKFGELADEFWVDCVLPSEVDKTLCPPDRHMLTCFVQYVPYRLREGDWNAQREAFGDRVVELIGRYAPNVPKSVIARKVMTPLDLEEIYGLTEGNIFHGDLHLGQLFSMRPHPHGRNTQPRSRGSISAAPGRIRAAASRERRGGTLQRRSSRRGDADHPRRRFRANVAINPHRLMAVIAPK